MPTIGLIGVLVAFAGVAVSIVCLVAGALLSRKKSGGAGETLTWGGHVAVLVTLAALTVCCGVLVYCFMTGDTSIEYVLRYRSDSSSDIAWLYKLSGLWAGREGSLLFWGWLIAIFNSVVAVRNMRQGRKLDSIALLVSQLVLAAFVGVILFSESNMPFAATPAKYFDGSGNLTAAASVLGMNTLLEHWAMAIHPPTLFVGYAGLTIPFAYAIAAIIVNDSSKEWVVRSQRYTLFSWFFLGVGIGLGAIWAYVVLVGAATGVGTPSRTPACCRGSWRRAHPQLHRVPPARRVQALVGHVRVPDLRVRYRGHVHLPFGSRAVGARLRGRSRVARAVRRAHRCVHPGRHRGPYRAVEELRLGLLGRDDVENMLSKDAAYYFNNVIMVVFAVLLTYLTVSSALPAFLPFGGQTVSAGTYNAIARPLGVIYLAILAVCPLLSWGRTEGKQFWKRARIPGICAVVLFAVLMFYFVTYLLPSYDASCGGRHRGRRPLGAGPVVVLQRRGRGGLAGGQPAVLQFAVHAGSRHPRLPEGAPRQRAGVRLGHAGEPRVHVRRLRRPPGHGRDPRGPHRLLDVRDREDRLCEVR